MKLRVVLACICLAGAAIGCEGMGGRPTKMAAGQLYESGDSKYDDYFKMVHEEQVAAANWADESKTARKPITSALNLPPTASNATILSAAKAKKDDAAVKAAAEGTVAAELAFAKKQDEVADRLDKLAEQGVELKKQAVEDRRNMGADKADPEKVEKKEEIKSEVSAAADVAANLRNDAKRGAKEANELAKALQKELGVSGDAAPKTDEPAPPDKKKDEPAAKKGDKGDKGDSKGEKADAKPAAKKPAPQPAAAKPAAKPAEGGAEKPAPAPKATATQKPAEEVFNP